MIRLTLLLTSGLLGVMLMHDPKPPAPAQAAIAVTPLETVAMTAPVPAPAPVLVEPTEAEPATAPEETEMASGLLAISSRDAPAGATRAATSPVALRDAGAGEVLVVTGSRVNLRAGPTTQAPVIGKLVRGSKSLLIGDAGAGWHKIRSLETGVTGFMSADFLAPVGDING